MSESTAYLDNPSFMPEKLQILSGSVLKLMACIIMLIDHTSSIILRHLDWAHQTLYTFNGKNYSIYTTLRNVGRLAFPIFCFLLVEGFLHTHDRFRYGRNLLIFSLISEIPWNIGFGRALRYDKQNVYFTLFFGFLTMCLVEYFENRRLLQVLALFGMLFVTVLFNADYSYRGYIFLMIMYFLRQERAAQALIGSLWLKYEWVAGFAFIPINMYNGKRGFIKSKALKYGFYCFYPVHITVLILIRRLVLGF